jgi:hypothetical protein
MKIAILTGLTGLNKATLKDPKINYSSDDISYFAFVEKKHDVKVWNQINIHEFSVIDNYTDRRNAKLAKMLGFLLAPGYDYYIWHDYINEMAVDPKKFVEEFLVGHDIALFKHRHRDCSYEEIKKLIEWNLDDKETLLKTDQFLRHKQFPAKKGLYALGAFTYKNTPKMQAVFLSWWEMTCKYSSRDQTTFPYVLWKHNIQPKIIPGDSGTYAGSNNIYMPQVRNKFS